MLCSAARVILDKAIAVIADNVRQVMEEINNKPVYTIHELLEGKIIMPQVVYVVGGPAAAIAPLVGCWVILILFPSIPK